MMNKKNILVILLKFYLNKLMQNKRNDEEENVLGKKGNFFIFILSLLEFYLKSFNLFNLFINLF